MSSYDEGYEHGYSKGLAEGEMGCEEQLAAIRKAADSKGHQRDCTLVQLFSHGIVRDKSCDCILSVLGEK